MINAFKKVYNKNYLLCELIIGSILFGMVSGIVIIFIAKDKLQVCLGLIVGIFLAVFMLWHMNKSINLAINMGEAGSVKHMKKSVVFRYAVIVVVMSLVGFFHIGNIVAILLGLMSIKVSAYCQPLLHKILVNIT